MRKILAIVFIFLFSLLFFNESYSWGFFAHKRINKMAVMCLPPEMIGFYKKHIDFISEHAVDPDKRRFSNDNEAPRHYIDIDHYGPSPFDSVPKFWSKAVEKYTEDTLLAYGILPWRIEQMVNTLTKAFQEGNVNKILHVSAELGHYVSDAHVPLHTTQNHNGQLTNQKGIHGFWETRIPELKADKYDYLVGRAVYLEKPLESAWKIIKASHAEVDSVLKFEAQLNDKFPADKKYSFEQKGKKNVKIYSVEYTEAYDGMLKGMTERRMRASLYMVASYWYTAWVNAGQPDLDKLKDEKGENSKEDSDSTVVKKIKHKFKENEE